MRCWPLGVGGQAKSEMKGELTTLSEFCTITLKNIKKASSIIKNSYKSAKVSVIAMARHLLITV